MRIGRKLIVAGTIVLVMSALALVISYQASKCSYDVSRPSYTLDGKFFSQMQFKLCRAQEQSRASLIVGKVGEQNKIVLLDLRQPSGRVNVSWHDGPELRVHVSQSAIIKRYGPYQDLPRIVINGSTDGDERGTQ